MVTHGNWAKQKKQEECCVTTLKTAAKETTGSGKATQPNFRNSSSLFLPWVSGEFTGTIIDKTKGIDMYQS